MLDGFGIKVDERKLGAFLHGELGVYAREGQAF